MEFGDVSATRCNGQGPTWSRCLNEWVGSFSWCVLLHVIREISKSLRIFGSRFMKLLGMWSLQVRRVRRGIPWNRGVPWTVFSLENWSCWRGQAWFEQRSFLDKLRKGDYFKVVDWRIRSGWSCDTFWWGSGGSIKQRLEMRRYNMIYLCVTMIRLTRWNEWSDRPTKMTCPLYIQKRMGRAQLKK